MIVVRPRHRVALQARNFRKTLAAGFEHSGPGRTGPRIHNNTTFVRTFVMFAALSWPSRAWGSTPCRQEAA